MTTDVITVTGTGGTPINPNDVPMWEPSPGYNPYNNGSDSEDGSGGSDDQTTDPSQDNVVDPDEKAALEAGIELLIDELEKRIAQGGLNAAELANAREMLSLLRTANVTMTAFNTATEFNDWLNNPNDTGEFADFANALLVIGVGLGLAAVGTPVLPAILIGGIVGAFGDEAIELVINYSIQTYNDLMEQINQANNEFQDQLDQTYPDQPDDLQWFNFLGDLGNDPDQPNLPNTQVPPIVIDLDGDGVEVVDFVNSTAAFDFDGDGFRERTSWAHSDDGILTIDADGSGLIDNANEIDFTSWLEGAQTDLEGLRYFDSNGDGQLTSADERWGEFRIWQDINQDGVSSADELFTLDEIGIQALDLTGEASGNNAGTSFVHNVGDVHWSDGSTTRYADIAFGAHTLGFKDVELETGQSARLWEDGGLEVVGADDQSNIIDFNGTSTVDYGVVGLSGGQHDDSLKNSTDDIAKLFGKGGNDTLEGGANNDLLVGGSGDDTLLGGAGDDTYIIENDGGTDTISDASGNDEVVFADGIGSDDLWFHATGDDLVITNQDTGGVLTVADYFSGGAIETIAVGDHQLHQDDVQALVDAMAALDADGDGQPDEDMSVINPEDTRVQAVNAAWQASLVA